MDRAASNKHRSGGRFKYRGRPGISAKRRLGDVTADLTELWSGGSRAARSWRGSFGVFPIRPRSPFGSIVSRLLGGKPCGGSRSIPACFVALLFPSAGSSEEKPGGEPRQNWDVRVRQVSTGFFQARGATGFDRLLYAVVFDRLLQLEEHASILCCHRLERELWFWTPTAVEASSPPDSSIG